jgi:ankyrin repeat protein
MLSLHDCALREASGEDVAEDVLRLLASGADPHRVDDTGQTAFNVAASNSPVTGRLLTLHWLEQALTGRGRGLNDVSGAHGSTLAQYIAKWLNDDEIEAALARAVAAGMKPDVPNKSGWTPLTAAAAMGRVKAVKAFMSFYTQDALQIKTTEVYAAKYNGVSVVYADGLTADQVASARLQQDTGAGVALKSGLSACVDLISRAFRGL